MLWLVKAEVGAFIGKRGCNVKSISKKHKCKILVVRTRGPYSKIEVLPRVNENSQVQAAEAACRMLIEKIISDRKTRLMSAYNMSDQSQSVTIPNTKSAEFFGPEMRHLNSLKSQHQVHTLVLQNSADTMDALLWVDGENKNIVRFLSAVSELV